MTWPRTVLITDTLSVLSTSILEYIFEWLF